MTDQPITINLTITGDVDPLAIAQSIRDALRPESPKVEPPTGWLARITATVEDVKGVRLARCDTDAAPWMVHPDDHRESCLAKWYRPDQLSDVVVLHPGADW